MDGAERWEGKLGELLTEVGSERLQEYSIREKFLRLAAQIAFSRGVDSPEACVVRLKLLHDAIYQNEIGQEGVGFTE